MGEPDERRTADAGRGGRPAAGARDDADWLPLNADQIRALTAVTARGGLVVFPAETVYGLATDPDDADAVGRMAGLKQRDPAKPSSVLFWSVDDALTAIEGAPDPVLRAVARLLPGPIGLIVPNPRRRFAPACGDDPSSLGIRVPLLDARVRAATALGGASDSGAPVAGAPTADSPIAGHPQAQRVGAGSSWPPIVQTSANLADGADPTTLAAVPAVVRAGADLILDAGERPGVASTIVDLRGVTDESPDGWSIVREGPVTVAVIAAALAAD